MLKYARLVEVIKQGTRQFDKVNHREGCSDGVLFSDECLRVVADVRIQPTDDATSAPVSFFTQADGSTISFTASSVKRSCHYRPI